MGDSEPVSVELHVGLDETGDPWVTLVVNDRDPVILPADVVDSLAVQLLQSSAAGKAMAATFRDLTMAKGWTPAMAAEFLQR